MKLFLADNTSTPFANPISSFLLATKNHLIADYGWVEVFDAKDANSILLNEKWSYKGIHYQSELLQDPFVQRHYNKIITINDDDYGTGFLRGLYVNISKDVVVASKHKSVPFNQYFNEYIFEAQDDIEPMYLAAWRGNSKSNTIRRQLISTYINHPTLKIESTDSWLNHSSNEKADYVQLILNAKFSLCPGGWGPSSFRIYESMALGRCPVILADKFSEPLGCNWKDFSIRIQQKDYKHIEAILNERASEYKILGKKAKTIWDNHFNLNALPKYYADAIAEISKHQPHLQNDIKSWESRTSKKIHGWRLRDRIFNKIRHLSSR